MCICVCQKGYNIVVFLVSQLLSDQFYPFHIQFFNVWQSAGMIITFHVVVLLKDFQAKSENKNYFYPLFMIKRVGGTQFPPQTEISIYSGIEESQPHPAFIRFRIVLLPVLSLYCI